MGAWEQGLETITSACQMTDRMVTQYAGHQYQASLAVLGRPSVNV